MKRKNFIVYVFLTAIISSGTVYAQETARPFQKAITKTTVKSDEVSVVMISATKEGCNIVVGNRSLPPKDPSIGLPAGKRMFMPFRVTKGFSVNSSENGLQELSTTKNPSTDMSSGKRTAGQPIGGIIVKGGRNPGGNQFNKIIVEDGEFTLPSDCPDGEYNMTLSWRWGASQSGGKKDCQKSFKLTMVNGVCKGINQAGIK
ncbi:MAG: hypothetical protein ABIW47_11645 [Ginsengibacter sp.]